MASTQLVNPRHKGVMCVKSSNLKGDMLIVSCGNEDDPNVKVWSLKDQSTVGKYFNQDTNLKRPYYYLNVIYLNPSEMVEPDNDRMAEEDKIKKGFVIIAAGIKNIDVYFKKPLQAEAYIDSKPTQEDIGSYLSSMVTVKHDEDRLTVLVGNVNGLIEMYSLRWDKQAAKDSQDLDDLSGSDDAGSKLGNDDSKKSNENRIKIIPGVDIKELIERRKSNGKFSELDIEQPHNNSEGGDDGNKESNSLNAELGDIDEASKHQIGMKDEEDGELSGIQSKAIEVNPNDSGEDKML